MEAKLAIFPLPNVILFPGTFLPLHIFEPRYRMMIDYTLECDKELGITSINNKSEIESIFGWGKIIKYEPFPDGRSNILLEGAGLARIIDFDSTDPFIISNVEKISNMYSHLKTEEYKELVNELFNEISLYLKKLNLEDAFFEEVEKLKTHPFPSEFVASILKISYAEKQDILLSFDPFVKIKKVLLMLKKINGI